MEFTPIISPPESTHKGVFCVSYFRLTQICAANFQVPIQEIDIRIVFENKYTTVISLLSLYNWCHVIRIDGALNDLSHIFTREEHLTVLHK